MMSNDLKTWVDTASVGALVGVMIGWLPTVALLLTVILTLIRVWETNTVQSLYRRIRGTNQ
jgi:hypothetical protein